MSSQRSHILFILILILVLMGGVSVNGKALSTGGSAALQSSSTTQNLSLLQNLQVQQSVLAPGLAAYAGYTEITDNEEKIKLQVPIEWSDIETGPWTYKNKTVGVYVAASADLANFYATRSQPGVLIGVSRSLAHAYGKEGLLGLEKKDHSRQCRYKGRFDYQNPFYSGQYDHFTNCSSGAPGLLIVTAASADQKSVILLRMNVVSEADLAAADIIMKTFQVLGDPERDEHHEN